MEKLYKRYKNANITRFVGEIIIFISLFLFSLAMMNFIPASIGGTTILLLLVAVPTSIIGEIIRIVSYVKIRKSEKKVGDINV